ncbi:MAG: DUF11 domain-containing protein [Ardenticatenaceae bacterium]|nr:DUF11 domain-containing protein [Ardenticatenaceae bacterium]
MTIKSWTIYFSGRLNHTAFVNYMIGGNEQVMESYSKNLRGRQLLLLFISLTVALLLGLALVQALVAAPVQAAVSQSDDLLDLPGQVITQTDGATFDTVLEDYLAGHIITQEELDTLLAEGADVVVIGKAPTDFDGSEKQVAQAMAQPGTTLDYTIVLSNSGGIGQSVTVTDTLPAELTLTGGLDISGDVVTISSTVALTEVVWTGTVGANGLATIDFSAVLTDSVTVGDTITNVAQIDNGSTILEVTAETLIVAESPTQTVYLPIIYAPLPELTLQASRPDSTNFWTVSWNDLGVDISYQLQESQDQTFQSGVTTYDLSQTSLDVNHPVNTQNVYYYRVRAVKGSLLGAWSDVVQVVGNYRDDFTSNTTGWEIRRTTYIEKVQTFYEISGDDDWLILRVEDSWDWGIASALAMAPEPPYVIEYRVKPANLGNLVSFGVVFGGDWTGEPCPDKSSVAGWYEHDICFNQFYNTNTIWFSGLKLLFERIDQLVWCPSCGTSPMKRLGDVPSVATDLSNVNADGWNTYRIEVKDSGIKFYANGSLQYTYDDTRYIDRPYFGVFASTDEYSNSTARFEYISVTALDN